MKYLVIFASLLIMGLSGCVKADKGCKPMEPSAEDAQMQSYITTNNITAQRHSSGMYYQVLNAGTGATPSLTSRIFITYTGRLLNGTIFDQSTDPSKSNWILNNLIEGWKIGVPLIKKGGKIKLIVPSTYGYGCNGAGSIPPNSILVFDIDLIDVQ